MPVPSSINDLSTTAGSNSPGGSETPGDGDNYLRAHAAFIASLRDKLNGTSDTGTVKSATFSGTMAGAASWSALQTFAVGIKAGNSAQSDGNTLDWYEEGTFTPAVIGESTAGSATYTRQTGRFTRLGRLVFVQIRLLWTGHTGSGVLRITGLPYAAAQVYTMRAVPSATGAALDAYTAFTTASQTYLNVNGVKQETGANASMSIDTVGEIDIQGFYEA